MSWARSSIYTRVGALTALFIAASCAAVQEEDMALQISLRVVGPSDPARNQDGKPVYAMKQALSLVAEFKNGQSENLHIQDPRTSQELLLWLERGDDEDAWFMLNPSSIDATGEITAPIVAEITLAKGETVDKPFDLDDFTMDMCFLPGWYSLHVAFLEDRSDPLGFGIELRPESVPDLVELVFDDEADGWLREQALEHLRRLPRPPEIQLLPGGLSDSEREELAEQNTANKHAFLDSWDVERNRDDTEAFFESMRLP